MLLRMRGSAQPRRTPRHFRRSTAQSLLNR
jgi:hypothetical protein